MMAMSDKSAYQETYIRAAGAIAFISIIKPQCDREAILGNRAKARLQELVATGRTHVSKIQCSCRPGTEGTPQCNYGRSCGVLTINGRDVGQILISEGLAVPYQCGPTTCPRSQRKEFSDEEGYYLALEPVRLCQG